MESDVLRIDEPCGAMLDLGATAGAVASAALAVGIPTGRLLPILRRDRI